MQTKFVTIDESHAGQRIDNFLVTQLKGVPHSRIYRALRKGEVRVNKGRVQAVYRLKLHDIVRLPPLRVSETEVIKPSARLSDILKNAIIFENDDFIVVNKPVGLAVHAGSEVQCGLIEAFRHIRPDIKNLSLVHRLDRDTSGCLLLAKNRATLLALQALQKSQDIHKQYLLLVHGCWTLGKKRVSMALSKNKLMGGERVVVSDDEGKPAETIFEPVRLGEDISLLRATLITGRTHQIRVHISEIGFPIVGDVKYGDRERDKQFLQSKGLKRLFLHAEKLAFTLPGKKPFAFAASTGDDFSFESLLR